MEKEPQRSGGLGDIITALIILAVMMLCLAAAFWQVHSDNRLMAGLFAITTLAIGSFGIRLALTVLNDHGRLRR